jgi:FMN phosphatase YigB (HAD superfamily)
LRYFSDSLRHLVCWPYSIANLHAMARNLGIKQCWYHTGASYPHYDIPKTRVAEIRAKTERVSGRAILAICKGEAPP